MKKSRYRVGIWLTGFISTLFLAVSVKAANQTVTSTADAGGSCPGANCTLRQALAIAVSGDTIVFQIPTTDPAYDVSTGYYTITLTGATAANKTLVIDKNLTIDGGSGRPIVVRRANNAPTDFRIFNVKSGVSATLSRIWISNGNLTSATASTGDPSWFKYGAGIQNFGPLTLRDCILTGNAAGAGGGALLAYSTTNLVRTTFSGNYGPAGGAIYNAGVGFVTIDTCTFTANGASEGGAIFNNHGVFTLKSCTISGNTATGGAGTQGGGGIVSIGTNSFGNNGSTHFENTIVAGNSAPLGPDVSGTAFSDGYNLIGSPDNNSGFTGTGDRVGVTTAQVNLKPLDTYGGFIPTMPPKAGSFAIDKGKQTTDVNGQPSTTDQRGQPRPIDRGESNAPGGDGSDIGAVEVGAPQTGPTFTVTTTAERNDGSCTADDCTLVDALNLANANADANIINFTPGLTGAIGTAILTPTGLPITNPVTINGPDARTLGVTGRTSARVFRVTSPGVNISRLGIVNGKVTDDNGGAITNSGGLTLTECTISNSVAFHVGSGGGVYNSFEATLTLVRCTLNGDSAGVFGGGVYNEGNFSATNCTFSNDTAVNGGGIISRFAPNEARSALLRNCTITGCLSTSNGTAGGGGGYYAEGGAQQYHLGNSIIAGNGSLASPATNPDVSGNFTTDGHNFIGNVGFSTGFTNNVSGDQVGTSSSPKNAQLDPAGLQNNGGPADTHALLSTSTAINAGDDALAPPTDQRGYGRNGVSDIGAFEFGGLIPSSLANISTRLRVETGDNVLIVGFIVTGTQPKKIIVRAIGPSLPFADKLADPILELHDSAGALLEANDNWNDSPNRQAIIDSTIPPTDPLESAIVRSVAPGNYTAIVRGVNNGTGIGVVEAYDLDTSANSKLANIATRGLVQTGDNVLFAGMIVIGQSSQKVIIRALGPSTGVPGAMADPTLELRDVNGNLLEANDNWVDSPNKQAIIDSTIPPTNDLESAIVRTLTPANYTAIVRGANNSTGIAVVEVYALN